ncbi:hypothetical protein P691DRAFT_760169 [Macrolepiota fuliginosa MF-IS2]|uniref:Uncharacterized protein n=1 Tax=Macrolepiota fuliginosa MF-IS2 TaxID=1400762 RepID=A0A9P6C4D6_9AGAR|nr:hypothetical protein P691DRAFT_760169 [Macrolepiota fuliginosa MF-IS2]
MSISNAVKRHAVDPHHNSYAPLSSLAPAPPLPSEPGVSPYGYRFLDTRDSNLNFPANQMLEPPVADTPYMPSTTGTGTNASRRPVFVGQHALNHLSLWAYFALVFVVISLVVVLVDEEGKRLAERRPSTTQPKASPREVPPSIWVRFPPGLAIPDQSIVHPEPAQLAI